MKEYQNKPNPVKSKDKEQRINYGEAAKLVKVVDAEQLMAIAEEGLSAMFFNVGVEAMYQILEQDVESLVGPKGKHNNERTATRHGTESTKVVLEDKKISVSKPRVRSEGHDVPLPSLPYFQSEGRLDKSILTSVLCGISTRKYGRTVTEDGGDGACVSKSEVSRRYNAELKKVMNEFFNRRLDETYPAIMIDGMEKGGMTIVAALGVTYGGRKEILGVVEGGTENSIVVKRLLEDLINRGLDIDVPRLFVLDGAKALNKAVRDTFGDMAIIQRCQVHKKRNVLSHLPQSEQGNVGLAISRAYMEFDYDKALGQLNTIADGLDSRYPDAAASMREGLEDTLTVHRLGVPGLLRKTLSNTNAMESANSVAAGVVRRISKWQDGEMLLRHMAAGFLEAERGFRRVQGYRQIHTLVASLYEATGYASCGADRGVA